MFNFLKKKQMDKNVYAPVSGTCIPLEKIADEVFSSKMMGEGVAFQYQGDIIVSPCDGVVTMVANTKHAIGIQADNGLEILIHVGLDTVNLNGKGFSVNVKQEQKVKVGDSLLTLDRSVFEAEGIDLTTPLIITNSNDFSVKLHQVDQSVEAGKSIVIEKVE